MTTPPAMLDATAAIRGAGLRVTEPRRAVYDALSAGAHASAEEIFARVQPHLPGTSVQSVYNALGDFAEAGLVRRIEPARHPMLFELHHGDNHHHLVCTHCGAVSDVACVVGAAPCLDPSDAQGFRVHEAEVTFWGTCPACAPAESTTHEEGTS